MKAKAQSYIATNHFYIIYILIFISLLLCMSLAARFISAQPQSVSQSLEISPPTQEITADPGQTLEVKAKIRNASEEVKPIRVRIENFVASGSEGQVALTETGPWAVSTWTTVSPEYFTLKAGESQEVTATIRVPATGAAGGRYGSFVFSVVGPEGTGTAASISQEVASLFLVRISGPVDEKLEIAKFSAPGFSEFGPIPLTITFNNLGNVHLKPKGTISVKDMLGRFVGTSHIEATNVFPAATRNITATFAKRLLIGRFTAQAVVTWSGAEGQKVVAETAFIVFPVRAAIVIIIVIVILYLLRRRLKKAWKVFTSN